MNIACLSQEATYEGSRKVANREFRYRGPKVWTQPSIDALLSPSR